MKLPLVLLASGLVIAGPFTLPSYAQKAETSQAAEQQQPPGDPGWPRTATSQGVELTVYQPQVDEWKDSRLLKARAAFVMTPGKGKPVVGVMELSGPTTTDLEKRTVFIREMKVSAVRFPSLPEAEVPATEALFRKAFPARSMTVSLDRLIAGLEHNAKPVELKMDPPRIVMSEQPALLLLVENKPVLAPVGEGQFVVNSNWDLFFDKGSSQYYLLGGSLWYSAKALDGEWALATELPAFLKALPDGTQWEHVKKAIPPKVEQGRSVPQVVFSDQPAELIVFKGNPVWEAVPGGSLEWGRNTESWVFRKGETLYFLASGRWFSAPGWDGPWSYAGNNLPEDFRKIPHDSDCAEVLASVPGTPEASDAILLASVPREAVVKVKEAEEKALAVYNGEPEFKPIEGTQMTYAVNTSADVVRVENQYYLCQNGVWFVSTTPKGPWKICRTVPKVIYTIPPSSPVHRVVYVTVEEGNSPDVVVCSYTAGYEGAYIAGVATGAVLVWGTGYYYPPYVAWGTVPVYYPYPQTYGAAAVYNPYTGGYAVGQRYYGPYGSAGSAAWYNPNTGNYGRAARVSTPYGASTYAAGYNPRTDTAWSTQQNYNGYSQWGSSAVQRGDDWLRTGHVVNENGGAVAWQGSEGGGHAWKTDNHSGGTAHHDGDFYAGHDGNVYKRDENGDWAKYDDGDWDSVDGPQRSSSQSERSQANAQERNRENAQQQQNLASTQGQGEAARERANRDKSETASETTGRNRGDQVATTQEQPTGENRRNGEQTREQTGERSREQTGERTREQSGERTGERTQRQEATTQGEGRQRDRETTGRRSTRQPSDEVSRQLDRDASNRRSGISREQRTRESRSFERRGGGRGEGSRGGERGGSRRGGRS